eukprot:4826732-Amphidinium_carterae.1
MHGLTSGVPLPEKTHTASVEGSCAQDGSSLDCIVPMSPYPAKISNGALQKFTIALALHEIQKRGRWASNSSLKIWHKIGRTQQLLNSMPIRLSRVG